jgi:hypothetical protein
MNADLAWKVVRAKAAPCILARRGRILRPIAVSPLR